LHESLDRLKTDYVDLFFIHGVNHAKEIDEHGDEWKTWAEKAKAAKKIKFFGFSTHQNMAESPLAVAKLGFIDAIMLKYDFRIMDQSAMKRAVDACVKAGIGLTAMKTQGTMIRKPPQENAAESEAVDQFVKNGFTDKQARLKAIWANKDIASICSQMPNLTILASNYMAATDKTKLSSSERRLLAEYASATRSSYCAGCSGICEPSVDGGLPIADVMRFLMYSNEYGLVEHARGLFAELSPEVRRRLASADYALAEARCPQRIAISEIMREAAKLLA
jgi:predicted aldo/keto reductase-like oxidoreductase